MKLLVFAVFDRQTGLYSSPNYFNAKGAALRSFEQACLDSRSDIHRFSEDYSFFHLGTYDDEKGTFENLKVPDCLAKAHEVIAKSNQSVKLASSENGATH